MVTENESRRVPQRNSLKVISGDISTKDIIYYSPGVMIKLGGFVNPKNFICDHLFMYRPIGSFIQLELFAPNERRICCVHASITSLKWLAPVHFRDNDVDHGLSYRAGNKAPDGCDNSTINLFSTQDAAIVPQPNATDVYIGPKKDVAVNFQLAAFERVCGMLAESILKGHTKCINGSEIVYKGDKSGYLYNGFDGSKIEFKSQFDAFWDGDVLIFECSSWVLDNEVYESINNNTYENTGGKIRYIHGKHLAFDQSMRMDKPQDAPDLIKTELRPEVEELLEEAIQNGALWDGGVIPLNDHLELDVCHTEKHHEFVSGTAVITLDPGKYLCEISFRDRAGCGHDLDIDCEDLPENDPRFKYLQPKQEKRAHGDNKPRIEFTCTDSPSPYLGILAKGERFTLPNAVCSGLITQNDGGSRAYMLDHIDFTKTAPTLNIGGQYGKDKN